MITFRINRFNPDDERRGHYVQEYQLDVEKGTTLLDALNEIKWKQDGTLTFRRSCRSGICGSCAMTINGVNNLACETQVLELGGSTVTIEPMRGYPVVKDLVVSLDPLVRGLLAVKPWLVTNSPPPSDQERLQSPAEREKLDGLYECILCGSCTSSCPSFWADKEYARPARLPQGVQVRSRQQGRGETPSTFGRSTTGTGCGAVTRSSTVSRRARRT